MRSRSGEREKLMWAGTWGSRAPDDRRFGALTCSDGVGLDDCALLDLHDFDVPLGSSRVDPALHAPSCLPSASSTPGPYDDTDGPPDDDRNGNRDDVVRHLPQRLCERQRGSQH